MYRIKKLKLGLILLQAAFLLPQFEASSKEENELQTPIKWTENWQYHHKLITRVYVDENVVIYYDDEVNQNNQSIITWPFALITNAWKYTKHAYPYFEENPLLYVIIHANNSHRGCSSGTYLEAKYEGRNMIDCGEGGPLTPTPLHSKFFHRLVTSFGHLVRRAANGLVNDADVDVCAEELQEIISWDVLTNLTDPSGRLQEWKTMQVEYAYKGVYWFQDWFIPIYEQFGGSSVINNYLNLTYTYLPHTSTNFDVQLNAGEVIHFWSEAAGVDLFPVIAFNAFIRTQLHYQNELIEARKSYFYFNYTVKDCDRNQLECGNGLCIQSFRRCNGIVECGDASDEENCTECASTAFQCEVGDCVPGSRRCDFKNDCPDSSDEKNCAEILNPPWLNVSWGHVRTAGDQRFLWRIYLDANLVVYTDGDLSTSQNNYIIFSEAWSYVKESYNFIKRDLPLVLVLKENTNTTQKGCSTSSNTSIFNNNRYLIECVHLNVSVKEWDLSNSETQIAQNIFHSLGSLVNLGVDGSVKDADADVCGMEMVEILSYDVISYLHAQSKNALNQKYIPLNRTFKGRHCFRDWYLPIYKSHGGSSTLERFYNVTNTQRSYNSKDIITARFQPLNIGQFVHFWSGAVQADLQELASHAFGWSKEYMEELLGARISYNRLNYALNEFQVSYADSEVAIYTKNTMYHRFPYAILSEAWKYFKTQYATFLSSPSTLQLQASARTYSITPVPSNCTLFTESTLFKRTSNFLQIIDCSPPAVKESILGSETFLDLTLAQMGELALNYSHGLHSGWPASQVSGKTLNSILVYDICLSLNDTKYAGSWILKQNGEKLSFPRDETFWFKDWYLKIYDAYGKNSVLKRFISLVNNSFKYDGPPMRQMNMGEFVHTWSGAAEVNLKQLARSAFGWNQTNEKQFIQARLDFQDFNYTCETPSCDEKQGPGPGQGNENVVAIGVGIFIFVLILIGFGVKIALDRKKIRRMSVRIRNLTNDEVDEFLNGNVNLNDTDVHRPIHSLPFISKYEIDPERLVINDNVTLGSGEFGVVKEGKLLADQDSNASDLTVAVKTVKPDVDVGYFKAFLAEIKIMAFLGPHENIASLLGTVTWNIRNCEVFVVMEYCSKGDLRHFLHANCDNFEDLFRPKFENASQVLFISAESGDLEALVKFENFVTDSDEADQSVLVPVISYEKSPISTLDLLEWSRQISEGMSYLTIKKVIHGDLAARNVLLTCDNNAKICDFGLSRQLINYSRYLKESVGPLPWAWLAVECFTEKSYSVHSDIWAFGITLWEIFTLGKFPYPGRTWNTAFVDDLKSGMRVTSPQYGNREIYNLMINCMEHLPSERIPVSKINLELKRIKENLVFNPVTPTTPNPTSAYITLN